MGQVQQICVSKDFLFGLLDEVSRTRALADHETDILEAIVSRGHRSQGRNVQWNARLDVKLMTASASKGGIKRFAIAQGISEKSAYMRLHKLRKKDRSNG